MFKELDGGQLQLDNKLIDGHEMVVEGQGHFV